MTHSLVKLEGNDKVPVKEPSEIVVGLWPHSEGDAGDLPKAKREEAENLLVVFVMVWLIVFLWHTVKSFNTGYFYLIKSFALLLIPLYAFTRKSTHIMFDRLGIHFQTRMAGTTRNKGDIYWASVQDIYLLEKSDASILNWHLCIKEKSGKTHKIKLSRFSDRRQWLKVVNAIRLWSQVPARGVDPDLFDALSSSRNDPTYTTLWLAALSSPPKRERLQPLQAGAMLNGRYKVTDALGGGGQGTAYLATDQSGERCVLKEYILPVFVDARARRKSVEQFQHEAQVLDKVSNKSIVRLKDTFIEDNRAYLVLEYIDGPSLKSAVKADGPFKEEKVIELGITMCEILSHLHGLTPPVVHRDFTPDNLILSESGELKLIDFMVAQDELDSVTPSVIGKHAYMPPEQLRGKATAQSDLYALGGTMFFLLTGMEPEAISQSRPSMFRDNLSFELDDIVARLTDLNPGKRYSSAEEVSRQLLSLADGRLLPDELSPNAMVATCNIIDAESIEEGAQVQVEMPRQ